MPDEDAVFHTTCDLKEKYQVGNFNFNNDLSDSWQLADNPQYPEKFSYLGIRLGLNYLVYTMTH